MRHAKYVFGILLFCIVIAGCSSAIKPSATSRSLNDTIALPATKPSAYQDEPSLPNHGHAIISSATYMGAEENNRRNVRIIGFNFYSVIANRNDCLESADGVLWTPCIAIRYAAAGEYDIIASHPSDSSRVLVKVLGQDGQFSDPVQMRTRRVSEPLLAAD
jgi:hypothetical protein